VNTLRGYYTINDCPSVHCKTYQQKFITQLMIAFASAIPSLFWVSN